MATPITRIEREFLLKILYDEQIPITCLKNRVEYILTMTKPVGDNIIFKSNRSLAGLKARKKLDLMFNHRNQVITFTAEVIIIKDDLITVVPPEFLYKDLDRSYSRVNTPPDLQVQFSFSGDRYSLSYPKIPVYELSDPEEFIQEINPQNLSGLIEQMASWIKGYADGYKLIIFKDVKPSTIEERIIAETGKTIYLPSTHGSFPSNDPYPRGRLITDELFKRYLESTGVNIAYLDDATQRFIKAKIDSGIFSDLWVPILFQEYVIGYIHAWISKPGKPPLNYKVIDMIYQFAAVLASSLKANGYFESGKMKKDTFEGKVIDISASGLLFAYPQSATASSLLPYTELSLQLITPDRTITTSAVIARRFKDNTNGYFGIRFIDMKPEDMSFLFEFIYGKQFTENDADFLAGKV